MTVRKKLIALSFIAGLSATLLAPPAYAAVDDKPQEITNVSPNLAEAATFTAPVTKLTFERPQITTSSPATAPVVEAPVEAVQSVQPESISTATKSTQTVVAPPAQPAVASPSPAPQPIAAASSPASPAQKPAASGSVVANAAMAQLGMIQDCTALVTRSLAAAGVNFHGWPAGYLSLGRTVSAAQAMPGDVIYYANGGAGVPHVAIYIGGGQAVHGGWNGNQTVVNTAFVGTGPVFIRVGG